MPRASSDVVRRRMERQKRRDTGPEVLVRKELHARGVRFRVDAPLEKGLRTRGDIVWKRRKVVVFIDGCFWHSCPRHGTVPKANRQWWEDKLTANAARDRRADGVLTARGWTVLRFWEHEPAATVADVIQQTLAAH